MARITGKVRIARPAAEVFDFIADSRNEPGYNPAMREVVLLTGEPIGQGTQFRARMGRGGMGMLVTLTYFERPRMLGSCTTSPLMDTDGTLTFNPDPSAPKAATTMSWDWQVTPKGWLRLLGPAFGPLGTRMERRTWAAAKASLEAPDPGDHAIVAP